MQNKNEGLISIIIPVYNTEQYFDRCIKSIQHQSYKNLEIIVVNDGSMGEISNLIQRYINEDPRIHYIDNQRNRGLYRARIEGIKASKGEYVAFVDSDDYVSYDFYRALYRNMIETDSDIVFGKTVWDDQGDRFIYNFHDSMLSFEVLEKDEIKERFFGQKLYCYSWHTVWNKLYSRHLWDKCLPILEQLDCHIVMTEDICFSSVLINEANRISKVDNEAYFYCVNSGASTDQSNISFERFEKNFGDIKTVFDFIDRYLEESRESTLIRSEFKQARKHYGRMWLHLLNQCKFNVIQTDKCKSLIKEFSDDLDLSVIGEDFFFESLKTKWNGGIEYFKEQIAQDKYKYVSFDIFDTLITRPLYEPEDLFRLMSPYFYELTHTNVSFPRLRTWGEKIARERLTKYNSHYQDVTLTEIYEDIGRAFGIDSDICNQLKKKECELELELSSVRKTGKELLDLAVYLGKEVLLISDMYLEREVIEEILKKNNITEYKKLYLSSEARKLKYNGNLFSCMLHDFGNIQKNTIHIGDSWASDIEGSKLAGISNLFIPKAKEVFENQIMGCGVNHCSDIGRTVCGDIIDYSSIKNNLGYRCMIAIAYNKYFDNPYRSFNQTTDFNADPYFIGSYALGMHINAIIRWIDQEIQKKGCSDIFFLARDGYLPFRAFEICKKYYKRPVKAHYLQASRKLLMPVIARSKLNYYELPIEYRAHTPMSLWKILKYSSVNISDQQFKRVMSDNLILSDKAFESYRAYCHFIDVYLDKLYDEQKHLKAINMLEMYYSVVKETNGVAFDMGYSGRIQEAISYCCGRGIDVLYLHQDYKNSVDMKRCQSFHIDSFYDFRPGMTGLIREHILSDYSGSCIGLSTKDECVAPIIEDEKEDVISKHVIQLLQTGAIDFVKTYMRYFGEYLDELEFSPLEASLPFEGFLRNGSPTDRKIFGESYFEDLVYGARERINVMEFLNQDIHRLNMKNTYSKEEQISLEKRKYDWFQSVLADKPKPIRALLMFFIDRDLFIRKLKKNFPILKRI